MKKFQWIALIVVAFLLGFTIQTLLFQKEDKVNDEIIEIGCQKASEKQISDFLSRSSNIVRGKLLERYENDHLWEEELDIYFECVKKSKYPEKFIQPHVNLDMPNGTCLDNEFRLCWKRFCDYYYRLCPVEFETLKKTIRKHSPETFEKD